jgi:hypothetical protein
MDVQFSRSYSNLQAYIKPNRVTAFYGARRTGKTTLVNTWLDTMDPSVRILRVTGDNASIRDLLSVQELAPLLDWAFGYDVIFIDEVQRIPGIGWALKLLIDARPELTIISTGSSSFTLNGLKPGRTTEIPPPHISGAPGKARNLILLKNTAEPFMPLNVSGRRGRLLPCRKRLMRRTPVRNLT